MKRRTMIRALASAPVALAATGAASYAETPESAPRCVFMEEREGAFVLEGAGPRLTEPFTVDPGRYRLEIDIAVPEQGRDLFVGRFYLRETGDRAGSFSTSSDEPGFSTSIDLRDGNEFLFESSMVDGDWKVVLSPI